MRNTSCSSFELARCLAGKNHAFCLRAEKSRSARSLKAPQATFSPYGTETV
jgi:hypothetical protein